MRFIIMTLGRISYPSVQYICKKTINHLTNQILSICILLTTVNNKTYKPNDAHWSYPNLQGRRWQGPYGVLLDHCRKSWCGKFSCIAPFLMYDPFAFISCQSVQFFDKLFGGGGPQMQTHVTKAFPKAITNEELVTKVTGALKEYGYGENTLLACSLCCDEVNRVLEKDFAKHYGDNFSMGGLAGFPFGGVTSFGAMSHHIPTGGSCLVVFGPHVGLGTLNDLKIAWASMS
jgi:hypothetical protein